MNSIASVAVFFPEKAATCQSSFRQVKPTCRVVLTLADGSEKTIKVPVRVGRVLQADIESIPSTLSDAIEYIRAKEQGAAFSYLVDSLSRRDHSKKEIEDKLVGQGFSPVSVNYAVAKAVDSRYLDDDRFAGYFIAERIRRGWGRIKIEQELRRKGVDLQSIPGYPEQYFDDASDYDRAMGILSRKAIPESKPYERLVRHLMSKGFPYSIARDVVHDHLERYS